MVPCLLAVLVLGLSAWHHQSMASCIAAHVLLYSCPLPPGCFTALVLPLLMPERVLQRASALLVTQPLATAHTDMQPNQQAICWCMQVPQPASGAGPWGRGQQQQHADSGRPAAGGRRRQAGSRRQTTGCMCTWQLLHAAQWWLL